MRTVHVIHCFDAGYALPAGVCFQSLLENARSADAVYALHVVGNLPESDREMLRSVVGRFANATLDFRIPGPLGIPAGALPRKSHYSDALYAKLALPELFPEIDRAIVADVDVVYQGDIAGALDAAPEGDGSLLSGVWDLGYAAYHRTGLFPTGRPFVRRYEREWTRGELDALRIGAGLVVYDMTALREGGYAGRWLDFIRANARRAVLPEQEAYNIVCGDRISLLPLRFMAVAEHAPRYDAMSADERAANPAWGEMYANPVQMHYASRVKPWKYPGSARAELWFAALARAGLVERWRRWYAEFSRVMVEESLERRLCDLRLGRMRLRLTKIRKSK